MGNLKHGAIYVYERVGDVTYAREQGSDPSTRVAIGWDARTRDGRPLYDHLKEDKLWGDIRRMALEHEGLREELERVIMFYRLLEQENNVEHHPV